ncbi:MAG: phospholipase A [Coxiellaceae bacterium]|nr:phospholipase A [Coxiellaceae bacterium]
MLRTVVIVLMLFCNVCVVQAAATKPVNKKPASAVTKAVDEAVAKTDKAMTDVTTNQPSDLQKKLHQEKKAARSPFGILFYEPTYVLPFYYTGSPDTAVYQGDTPENQKVMNSELKAQLSLQVPVWHHMFGKRVSLMVSYTQLSYWQVYAKSQWFRETNYEPQIFLSSNFKKNWLVRVGLDHQSNGRGGELERSWNRVFAGVSLSRGGWLFTIEPWVLIFKADSSDLHNPNIATYLGHERFIVAYKFDNKVELSLEVRNVERLTTNMTEVGAISVPLTKHLSAYLQVFNGYGQSLIEYNHRTTSAGIGIALSNWL